MPYEWLQEYQRIHQQGSIIASITNFSLENMPTVCVKEINLYYEQHGAAEPLILIQGLGLDSSAWLHQIPMLSQHYQIICLDNRGIGRTDAPQMDYSTEQMAEDTIALLDSLEIRQAHVLGFSLGGCIAQTLALRYPERIRRLILVNTAAHLPAITRYIIQVWLKMLQAGVAPEIRMRTQLPWLFTDTFFQNEQQIDQLINASLQYPYVQTVEGYMGQVAACVKHDTSNHLEQIMAPTLVLAGQADRLIPVASSQGLAAAIPGALLHLVENGGHNFFWESPELFNQAVLDFLGQ